jgi:hypothetical protein
MKTLIVAALLLLTAIAIVPSGSADPQCYPVYSRTDIGTYSIVRRSSCSVPEVYSCPYEGAPIDQCDNVLGVR